jgi:hypothetical protein
MGLSFYSFMKNMAKIFFKLSEGKLRSERVMNTRSIVLLILAFFACGAPQIFIA